jgi:hypothetical protein
MGVRAIVTYVHNLGRRDDSVYQRRTDRDMSCMLASLSTAPRDWLELLEDIFQYDAWTEGELRYLVRHERINQSQTYFTPFNRIYAQENKISEVVSWLCESVASPIAEAEGSIARGGR